MLIPEYTITSEILKNISAIEYGKGIIENTKVLPNWEDQLRRDAVIRDTHASLSLEGYNVLREIVKRTIDKVTERTPKEIVNYLSAKTEIERIAKLKDFDEDDIKEVHAVLTKTLIPQSKQGKYRSTANVKGVKPEEILANMVELLDWYHSLDAKETHPVITAGIMRANLETIAPFETANSLTANLITQLVLVTNEYSIRRAYSLADFYNHEKIDYGEALNSVETEEGDLTKWLEYFTRGMASEIFNLKEKVLLLAKDTKIAKATGRVELTKRQEKIVLYLQDYGLMKNKDFTRIFPQISEDTVLRDLKVLIEKGVVVKKGKTKSSRYELRQ